MSQCCPYPTKNKTVHSVCAVTEDLETASEKQNACSVTLARPKTPNVHTLQRKAASHPLVIFAIMLLDQWAIWIPLDCGINCKVIPEMLISSNVRLKKCGQVVVMYKKTILRPMSKCKLLIRNPWNKRRYRLEFIVVDTQECHPLLNSRAVQALDLVMLQLQNILNMTKKGHDGPCPGFQKNINNNIIQRDENLEGKLKLELDPHM